MQARYELVEELKRILLESLRQRLNNKELYAQYLHNFIVQVIVLLIKGMLRMMERNVYVEVKTEHRQIAKSVFGECEKSFSDIMLKETGKEM